MNFKKLILTFAMILLAGAVFADFASANYDYTTSFFYNGTPVNGVSALVYTCSDSSCNTLVSPQSFNTTSNSLLISYHTPAPQYGYASFVFSPGFRYKTNKYKPLGSGSSSTTANFTKYAGCNASINSFSFNSIVNASQEMVISAEIQSAISKNPTHTWGEPNDTSFVQNYLSALTDISITITEQSSGNVVYSNTTSRYIFRDSGYNETFRWTPSLAQAGVYNVKLTTNVSDIKCLAALAVTQTKNLTVNNVNPIYSNLVANPSSPATYAPGQNYTFNSTWTDDVAIDSVWMVFNGTTYTATPQSGDVYSVALSDLAAGNYSYQWFANDTSGNSNSADVLAYTINKAVPVLSVTLEPAIYVINGTETTATGSGCPAGLNGTCKLYRNGAEVANPDTQTFAIGVYTYVYNTTGNENYLAKRVQSILIVAAKSNELSNKTYVVTDNDFANGYTKTLKEGEQFKFNLCGMPFYLRLLEIDNKTALFKVTPTNTRFNLEKNEYTEIDLTQDNAKDLYVKVESISTTSAKVYIKKSSSSVCPVMNAPVAESSNQILLGGEKATIDLMPSLIIGFLIGIVIMMFLIVVFASAGFNQPARKKLHLKPKSIQ